MAQKSLRALEFLPFHEAAAGEPWNVIGDGLQAVIVALLRLSGLGFLIVGLCVINSQLHSPTNAQTPWKGSLCAAIVIAAALALSMVQ